MDCSKQSEVDKLKKSLAINELSLAELDREWTTTGAEIQKQEALLDQLNKNCEAERVEAERVKAAAEKAAANQAAAEKAAAEKAAAEKAAAEKAAAEKAAANQAAAKMAAAKAKEKARLQHLNNVRGSLAPKPVTTIKSHRAGTLDNTGIQGGIQGAVARVGGMRKTKRSRKRKTAKKTRSRRSRRYRRSRR